MDSDEFLRKHPAETCDVQCMNCEGDVPDYDYLSAFSQRHQGDDWSQTPDVDNCMMPIWFCGTHNVSELDA